MPQKKFVKNQELPHDTEVRLEVSPSTIPPEEADRLQNEAKVHPSTPVIGKLGLSAMELYILDVRDKRIPNGGFAVRNRDFLIWQHAGSFKGLQDDERVTLGHEGNAPRFEYPPDVSRKHAEVWLDSDTNSIHVRNLKPTNITTVTGSIKSNPEDHPLHIKDEYTRNLANDLKYRSGFGNIDGNNTYFNHALIDRTTNGVDNKIYYNTNESVLVDHLSSIVQRFDSQLITRLRQTPHALCTILETTNEAMPYDMARSDNITRDANGNVIGLSRFMEARAGVCRHQALLAAHSLGIAISNGFLDYGTVHVERNIDTVKKGGHAWALYRPDNSEPIVVDVAGHFIGTKAEARKQGKWDYSVRTLV